MSQKYAAYNTLGAIVGLYDSVASPVPSNVSAIEITDDEYGACKSAPANAWLIVNGALVAAPAPTAAQLLAQAQADQIATLTASYQSAITAPVSYTSKGGVTKTYQADPASQTLLMQATQGYGIAGGTPTGFYWKSGDNTEVPFTLADLQGLYMAMLSQGWAAFQHLQSLKAQVIAATSISAVQAITW